MDAVPTRPPLPYFSYGLIAASIAMFFVVDRWVTPTGLPIGALFGPLVRSGQWWRVLGFAIEHGSVLHIALNLSVVYTLGTVLERIIGTARFVLISVVTCLGSAAFALAFNFKVPTVGASGMILGWAGAMLPISSAQGRRSLFVWLIQVALISLIPGVSWAGHLGGFLFGLPCGLALRSRTRFWSWAPVLLFVSAVATVIAAHPERYGHSLPPSVGGS